MRITHDYLSMRYLEEPDLLVKPIATPTIPHGMFDGKNGDVTMLHTADIVEQCVRSNISHSTPSLSKVLTYEEGPAELHGVTAFSLLPGSHLTVHTYSHPTKRFAFCDSFGKDIFHNRFYANLKEALVLDGDSMFALVDRENSTILHNTFLYQTKRTYGPHLTAAFEINPSYVMDKSYFEYCLTSLIETIAMTKLMGPFSIEDDTFLSVIIIIAESHLTFHFNKESNMLYIDIFSCKEFSLRKTIRALVSLLPGKILAKKCIHRGHAFYA